LGNSNLQADSVFVRTATGTVYKQQKINGKRYIYFVGSEAKKSQELFASIRLGDSIVNIGKLHTINYDLQTHIVNLVPFNTTKTLNAISIQNQLNRAYKQALIKWTVNIKPNLAVPAANWDINTNNKLNCGSNLFTKYSTEMQALNTELRSQSYYNNHEFYIIASGTAPDSLQSGLLGEMPRNRSIGYVFTSTNPSDSLLTQVIAHELGHGYATLEHTFPQIPTGGCANLMDYPSDLNLARFQWDLCQEPNELAGLFDNDGDAAIIADDRKILSSIFCQIKLNLENGISVFYPFKNIDATLKNKSKYVAFGGLDVDNLGNELKGYISLERLNTSPDFSVSLLSTTNNVGTLYNTIKFGNNMEYAVANNDTYNYIINLLTTKVKTTGVKAGKIIFVNGHYNEFASSLGFSKGTGYKTYWASDFETKAKIYFNENSNYNLYVDGTSSSGGSESGTQRKLRGKQWATDNYELLISNMSTNGTFKIISHSEGGAFAAGIADYLIEKGKTVDKAVYLSTDEADEFSSPSGVGYSIQLAYGSNKRYETSNVDISFPVGLHFPYDPVVGDHWINGVNKYGVVLREDLSRNFVHPNTAYASKVFDELKDLETVELISSGPSYNLNWVQSNTLKNSRFIKINAIELIKFN
jgi:hypothetical protein